jgi:hypothetical protein
LPVGDVNDRAAADGGQVPNDRPERIACHGHKCNGAMRRHSANFFVKSGARTFPAGSLQASDLRMRNLVIPSGNPSI